MSKSIPDRWTNYKPMGKKIEGTRFVAFKVPLRKDVSDTVDLYNRLDAKIILRSIPQLGLIIDLTNTCRYYDPVSFKSAGIKYKKLMIPGREVPSKIFSDNFVSIVNEFMKSNNDKLIGVHCTHGVNRSGYMICNYMITEMNIEPTEAIDRFQKARGHKIERENYVKALKNLSKKKVDKKNRKKIKEPCVQPDNWRLRLDQTSSTSFRSEYSNRSESCNYKNDNSNWKERNWRQETYEKNSKSIPSESSNRSGNSNYKYHEKHSKNDSPYERSGYYYKSRSDSSRGKTSDTYKSPFGIPHTENLNVMKPH